MSSNRRRLGAWAVAALLALTLACTGGRHVRIATRPAAGRVEQGLASWYGKEYHGRRTASGEVFDMHGLTAAHRTLPFGTVVSVTNLSNGRSLDVRINDRGPFVDGRIIDLSYAAARRLKMVTDGVVRVRLTVLSVPARGSGHR